MDNCTVNNQKIKSVFQTMEYGKLDNDTGVVKDWLMERNNVIYAYESNNLSEVQHIINNVNSGEKLVTVCLPDDDVKQKIENSINEKAAFWANISNLERTKLMKKFALEIENNGDLICKIEACTRGILVKDTKKYGISTLVESLLYYSNWTTFPTAEPPVSTVAYATDTTCLGLLGYALGPALAHGATIILHLEPALSVCGALLVELSVKVGIPHGVIKLLPSGEDLWIPADPAMVYLFGNLQNEKFKKKELYTNKKTVALPSGKTPIIIFNNSDLDSACECLISAIWEYQGMLPWTIDTILVQEDIFTEFLEKIKKRMNKIRIGNGIDKLADISCPQLSEIKKLDQMINDAHAQGIDVYQSRSENSKFYPTLFIGAKVYPNNVMGENKNVSASATIVPFRTPKEAVALANNNRQGFAASVWCDNINLINEVSRQLNVGTIWINTHGLVKASVPFSTYKLDGTGYIGGSLGFYEYQDQCVQSMIEATFKSNPNVISCAQKAQSSWSKLSPELRAEQLSKWAINLEQHKSEILGIPNVDDFIVKIYDCIAHYSTINTSRTVDNLELIVKREPRGIVVLLMKEAINTSLILGALLLGNAVVLITEQNPKDYETFSKFLPSGLLSPVDISNMLHIVSAAETNARIVFIGINTKSNRFQKTFNSLGTWDFILRHCTMLKNIWLSVGDSI